MTIVIIWFIHITAHLLCKKPSLVKDLQTKAANSIKIIITYLQSITKRTKIKNQSTLITQSIELLISFKKASILESDVSPLFFEI